MCVFHGIRLLRLIRIGCRETTNLFFLCSKTKINLYLLCILLTFLYLRRRKHIKQRKE